MVTNMKNSTTCPMCRAVVDHQPRIAQQLEDLTYEEVEDLEYSITELTGRNQETSRAIMTYIASQMARNGASTLTGHMEVGVRGIVTRYVSEIVHDFVHILGEFTNAEGEAPVGVGVGDTPTIRSEVEVEVDDEGEVDPLEDEDDDLEETLLEPQTLSDVLCNYYFNMCSAAAGGDPLAIRFREWIKRFCWPYESALVPTAGHVLSYSVCDQILADQESRNWRRAAELVFSEVDTTSTSEGDSSENPVGGTPTTPIRVPEEIHAIDQLPAETINYIDCIINTNFELNEINFLHELPEFQIINNVRN